MHIGSSLIRRVLPATVLALGLVLAPLAGSSAAASSTGNGDRVLFALMSGAAEPNGGDADGFGVGVFRFNKTQDQVCYFLLARRLDGNTVAAHIHRAPAGVNGPIVIPLQAPVEGSSHACAAVTPALAAQILANPSAYYVNVHTSVFPGGAVRDQLR